MPITPPLAADPPLRYTLLDLATNSAIEAGWLAPGEVLDGETAGFILSKYNDLLDEWSAQKLYAFAMQFQLYTLVPGLSPHTIGPDPDATFQISQRPMRLENAAIVIPANSSGSSGSSGSSAGSGGLDTTGLDTTGLDAGGSGPQPPDTTGQTNTDIPLYLGDADWWAAQWIKDLQSQIPIGVYYQPDWPNGSLFFWPVPNYTYRVRLEMWGIISQFSNLQQTFSMPPAYRKALTLTVAEELGGPLADRPLLSRKAAGARAAIRQNNDASPRITTNLGMPGGGRRRTDFDFLSGRPW